MRNKLTYHVPDMSCAHCSGTITQGLDGIDGVDGVHVDLDAKHVTVTGHDLMEDAVADAILHVGYTPQRVG